MGAMVNGAKQSREQTISTLIPLFGANQDRTIHNTIIKKDVMSGNTAYPEFDTFNVW